MCLLGKNFWGVWLTPPHKFDAPSVQNVALEFGVLTTFLGPNGCRSNLKQVLAVSLKTDSSLYMSQEANSLASFLSHYCGETIINLQVCDRYG